MKYVQTTGLSGLKMVILQNKPANEQFLVGMVKS
jgi:hypothetical protein